MPEGSVSCNELTFTSCQNSEYNPIITLEGENTKLFVQCSVNVSGTGDVLQKIKDSIGICWYNENTIYINGVGYGYEDFVE